MEHRMRQLFFFILMSVIFGLSVTAQETGVSMGNDSKASKYSDYKKDSLYHRQKGEVTYIQEERISIMDDYMKANPIKHEGYRIQLVFGSRDEVSRQKSKFLAEWDYSAYESYLQPNFRLRVGDFMTRFEAEKALKELKASFPGAYVVPDRIEVPKEFK